MTATQHNPSTIHTDSLPVAIRRLEAAGPGDLATAEGGFPCAMKMEPDSGRPWLLDPWGHQGTPARVTTATVAQMGYRTDAEPEPRKIPENTEEDYAEHIEALREAGFDSPRLAEAAGVSVMTARRALKGSRAKEETRIAILSVDPDSPIRPHCITREEQAEDLEWLLDGGVRPEQAALRCGYKDAGSAQRSMELGGRADLAARLYAPSYEPREIDLDDYDPYTDPAFEEN